eukprot:UN14065
MMLLQEYITNLIFSNFILSKIFFNSKIITCYSKKLERPRFGGGGGQFAAFYKNVELVAKLDYCD